MADEEPEEGQPSLELPSIGLPSIGLPSIGGWRRKRRARAPKPGSEPEPLAPRTAAPGGGLGSIPHFQTEPKSPPPAPTPLGARWLRIRPRRSGGYPEVLGAGLVVGVAMVALMWSSLRACEQVQGTSSCGTAGYPMLLVVLVAAVVLGGLLLRLLHAPDPMSTSFLGVGLATVLALLFLVDVLDQTPAVVIVPVLTAACFAAAHWVTTTFIEPGDRPR